MQADEKSSSTPQPEVTDYDIGVAVEEAAFYIPATSSPTRPRRSLKHDDTFAIFDSHGDIGASAGAADGLFHCDTRHLSHLELLVDGMQPLLLGSVIKDDNLAFHADLTNPDIFADDRIALAKDTVHIARTIYLYDGSLRQRLALVSHAAQPITLMLSIAFGSDFADLFEVRGMRRQRRGRSSATVEGVDKGTLSYHGLDGVVRQTELTFSPVPTSFTASHAGFAITLVPGQRMVLLVTCSCRAQERTTSSFLRGLSALHRHRRRDTLDVASVETSNKVLNEMLCRSVADMYMLVTSTEDGPYPYAGIPWYSTTFGRDAIVSAFQMLWLDPLLARGVLRRLARTQALTHDDSADAAPGKIIHEMRSGEMAQLAEIPFRQYYGTIDATPLFVMLAGAYFEHTRDIALLHEVWPAVVRALAWMDSDADPDGDGFVEYARANRDGLVNQGWKDSHDAVFHADGTLARGPIALVEVQGYVYAAKMAAAACASAMGDEALATRLKSDALALQQRFEAAFWSEDLQSYVLALDGDKQQCRVLSSNAGHALFCGIASPARAHAVARKLMMPRFSSGWGIRTIAVGEARYNPMSYHNGSIWPHDNAMIALGMSRYGMKRDVESIFESLFHASTYMDQRRLPELYCGFRRRKGQGPTLYPTACSPQAWAAGAPFMLLQSLLGLQLDHARRHIVLHNPTLPPSVDQIAIRNMRLGDARADFTVSRRGGSLSMQLDKMTGDVGMAVVVQPSSDR